MKINLLYIFIIILFISIYGCQDQESKNKISGNRIISLSPHITEIIYAIGAEDELIAVSDFCRFPPEANNKEKIGGLINPNIEKIVSLRPTVLIGVPSHAKLSDELAKFDLSVVMLANENITDVLATIDSIGHLIHRTEDAANLIQSIKDSLLTLASDSYDPGPSAMLVIGREKGTVKNITVAGDDTFINEIWQLVGGTNLFLDLPSRYSSVNLETIITRNPEVIIEFNIDGAVEITRTEETQIWKQLKNISAVRDGNIYNVGGSHTLIPGPRIVLLAKQFKDIIDKVSLETKN